MSEDEIVVTIAAVALGPVAWLVWFLRASAPRRLDLRPSGLWTIAIAVAAIVISIAVEIRRRRGVAPPPVPPPPEMSHPS